MCQSKKLIIFYSRRMFTRKHQLFMTDKLKERVEAKIKEDRWTVLILIEVYAFAGKIIIELGKIKKLITVKDTFFKALFVCLISLI